MQLDRSLGKVARVVGIILGVVLGSLVLLVAALLLASPGRARPLVDASGASIPGSISEKVFVDVNGVRQGMFIEGRDLRNPVLLFVHGGPGMPEHFLAERYPTGLEDLFTVVWWERRGAGLSFRGDIPPETMTTDQMVADTVAVTNYLRERFGQAKIYLMAHSGGSVYGILAASRAPELYHAYIGVAQMANQLRSEQLAYAYMLQRYRDAGDVRMVRRLEAAPPSTSGPLPAPYLALRDEAMHRLGVGTARDMRSVITGIFIPTWLAREYTLPEKVNLWRGKIFSQRHTRDDLFATDLTQQVTTLSLPVYFFHGRYDYTCSHPLAAAFLERIDAPVKGFYTFEASAHSPIFEEPARARRILLGDVLAGDSDLADAPAPEAVLR